MEYAHFFSGSPALCEVRHHSQTGSSDRAAIRFLSTLTLNVDMLQQRKRELTSLQMKQGLKCFVEQQPSSLVMKSSDKRNKEASCDSPVWLQWRSCCDGCWREMTCEHNLSPHAAAAFHQRLL